MTSYPDARVEQMTLQYFEEREYRTTLAVHVLSGEQQRALVYGKPVVCDSPVKLIYPEPRQRRQVKGEFFLRPRLSMIYWVAHRLVG